MSNFNYNYNRTALKSDSWKNLSGNWFKAVFLMLAIWAVQVLSLNFVPFLSDKTIDALGKIINQTAMALDQARPDAFIPMLSNAVSKTMNVIFPTAVNANTIALIIFSLLLFYFLTAPLNIGVIKYFQLLSRGKSPKLRVAFSYFANLRSLIDCVFLRMLISLIYCVWFALLFALPAFLAMSAFHISSIGLFSLSMLLCVPSSVIYFMVLGAYLPAEYLLASGEAPLAAVKKSFSYTKGKLGMCALYRLSFFPWILLSYITGLVYFVYQPFYITCTAKFSDFLSGEPSSQPEA